MVSSGAPASDSAAPQRRRARLIHWLLRSAAALVAFAAGGRWLAYPLAARDADRWFASEPTLVRASAWAVSSWLKSQPRAEDYRTGSARFDGEWLFGTYMMAGMGFGQIALEHAGERQRLVPELERVLDVLLSPAAQRFDLEAWGASPLASLDSPQGHAAYLGYLGLVLGLHRTLAPRSRFTDTHDRVSSALRRRLEATPRLLLETYPQEAYVVDNAAVVGAIALHARATGAPRPALVDRWVERARARFTDPDSGLFYQSWDLDRDVHLDAPRGSGSALASYFLAYADLGLSRELHRAIERALARPILGFGLMQEYPAGWTGRGDIDSGPLVIGYSISATGFALAGCRVHQDRSGFAHLYATFDLLGAPLETDGRRSFVAGGPLADAIMLAMLTAPRGGLS